MLDFLKSIREDELLRLLVFVWHLCLGHFFFYVPSTLLLVLSILAIVRPAAFLSLATERVAERTGDTIGELLHVTLGNLPKLFNALAALGARQIPCYTDF